MGKRTSRGIRIALARSSGRALDLISRRARARRRSVFVLVFRHAEHPGV